MKAKTLWFTGLPCSGKTTLADAVKRQLTNIPTVRLDGDHVREGLSAGLGWTAEGRIENIRRCAHVAQLLNEQNIIVLASFITPLHFHQDMVRDIIDNVDIIHVNTSAELCEQRDVKGMWARARAGQIRGFTGYDSCYEAPVGPECVLDTRMAITDCVRRAMELL